MTIFTIILLAVPVILAVIIIAGVPVSQKMVNIVLLALFVAYIIGQSNWLK